MLETDHKPLIYIFGDKKELPQMVTSRVQRWAVFLSGYDYEIRHIKGSQNLQADCLSRLHEKNNVDLEETELIAEYSFINCIKENIEAISLDKVREETRKDKVLSVVYSYIVKGWPEKVNDDLKVFEPKKHELTLEEGCVMWGHKLVIPPSLRRDLLNELHDAHTGDCENEGHCTVLDLVAKHRQKYEGHG